MTAPRAVLLPAEAIKGPVRPPQVDAEYNADRTNQKYISGEVRIVTEQARYPLPTIPEMLKQSDKYRLQPEYQRRRRWDNARKSRLIESFIINVPIPPVFLYEYRYAHYEVMDGQQRLTTLRDFYSDAFELEDLREWPELNGLTYSRLPEKVREGIDRRYLSSVILLQETAKSEEQATRLKQLVFERLNSGGVELAPQETRNALHDGRLNQLCLRLSRDRNLCRMWQIPEPDSGEVATGRPSDELLACEAYRTMEDVELVLRFFAYRQVLSFEKRYSLTEFLNFFQREGNKFPIDVLDTYASLFRDTAALAYELLGEQAFWLRRRRVQKKSGTESWSWRESPSKVLYEPLMYVLSMMLPHRERLLARGSEVRERLETFYETNYTAFEGRYTNRANIEERNTLFHDFFSAFIV